MEVVFGMDKNGSTLPLILAFLLVSGVSAANQDQGPLEKKTDYLPFLQVGGTRFFNVTSSNFAASLDFFIPIWQEPTNLVFTDLRVYDRSGKQIEGNFHLGYRHLLPEKQILYGFYSAFDCKRTNLNNKFTQLTLGGEFWWDKVFLGGNFYQPIGNTAKFMQATESATLKQVSSNIYNIWITNDEKYEKAMGGVDAEAGYELTKGLTGYIGGYYFKKSGVDTVAGPKAKITYDWSRENGQKIGGLFDKLGLETGIQNDKPRGTIWYLSANFRIGLLPTRNTNLQGAARHMIDLIRRDVDIVASEAKKSNQEAYKENDEVVTIGIIDDDAQKIISAAEQIDGPHIIFTKSSHPSDNNLEIKLKNKLHGLQKMSKTIILGDHLEVLSPTGQIHKIKIPKTEASKGTTTFFSGLQKKLVEQNQGDLKIVLDINDFKDELLPKSGKQYLSTETELNSEQSLKKHEQIAVIEALKEYIPTTVVEDIKKHELRVTKPTSEQLEKKYSAIETELTPEQPLKKYIPAAVMEKIKKYEPLVTEPIPEKPQKKYLVTEIEPKPEQPEKKYLPIETEPTPEQSVKKYTQITMLDESKKYSPGLAEISAEQILKKHQEIAVIDVADSIDKHDLDSIKPIPKRSEKEYVTVETELTSKQLVKEYTQTTMVDESKKYSPNLAEISAEQTLKKHQEIAVIDIADSIDKHDLESIKPIPKRSEKEYVTVETELTSKQPVKEYTQTTMVDESKKYSPDLAEISAEQTLKKHQEIAVIDVTDSIDKHELESIKPIPKQSEKEYVTVETELNPEQMIKKYAQDPVTITPEQPTKKYQMIAIIDTLKKYIPLAVVDDIKKYNPGVTEPTPEQPAKKYSAIETELTPEQPVKKYTSITTIDDSKKYSPDLAEISPEQSLSKHQNNDDNKEGKHTVMTRENSQTLGAEESAAETIDELKPDNSINNSNPITTTTITPASATFSGVIATLTDTISNTYSALTVTGSNLINYIPYALPVGAFAIAALLPGGAQNAQPWYNLNTLLLKAGLYTAASASEKALWYTEQMV